MPAAIDAKVAASSDRAVRNSFTCVKEMPHKAQPAAAAVSAIRSLFMGSVSAKVTLDVCHKIFPMPQVTLD